MGASSKSETESYREVVDTFTYQSVLVLVLITLIICLLGVRIVLYKIYEKLGELDSHRAAVTKQMNFLSEAEPETFLNKAIDCHLRLSTVANK